MTLSIQQQPSFLRRKQVETRTGLSRSTIYQYVKDGIFPKPVPLGPRAVGWLESDVGDWIAARVKNARDSGRQAHVEAVVDGGAHTVGNAQHSENSVKGKNATNSSLSLRTR